MIEVGVHPYHLVDYTPAELRRLVRYLEKKRRAAIFGS